MDTKRSLEVYIFCRGPSIEELKEIARKHTEETGEPWGPLLGAADN